MAVTYEEYQPPKQFDPVFFFQGFNKKLEATGTIDREQLSSSLAISNNDIERRIRVAKEEEPDKKRKFEIAYPALADRRGVNATPAGRSLSRKIWMDAGQDAAKWLIDQLEKEQHPEMIDGIAETLTELGSLALSAVLSKLEEESEAKSENIPLLDALSWMALKQPLQSSVKPRIESIIKRYLEFPSIDCKIAAIQLTRLLDDDAARSWIETAKQSADSDLQEEIDDLLDERFG